MRAAQLPRTSPPEGEDHRASPKRRLLSRLYCAKVRRQKDEWLEKHTSDSGDDGRRSPPVTVSTSPPALSRAQPRRSCYTPWAPPRVRRAAAAGPTQTRTIALIDLLDLSPSPTPVRLPAAIDSSAIDIDPVLQVASARVQRSMSIENDDDGRTESDEICSAEAHSDKVGLTVLPRVAEIKIKNRIQIYPSQVVAPLEKRNKREQCGCNISWWWSVSNDFPT